MATTVAARTAPAPPAAAPSGSEGAPACGRGSATGWVALGLGAVGSTVLVGRALGHHLPTCALREHAGVACPVCGLTRLADHLVHGRIGAAVSVDGLGVLLLVLLGVVAATQLLALAGRRAGPRWLRGPALPVALGGLALARWAVVVASGGPGT